MNNYVKCNVSSHLIHKSMCIAEKNVSQHQKQVLWPVVTTTITTLHPFNGLFSRTTWVSQYQKCKTSLDLNEARDDGVLG